MKAHIFLSTARIAVVSPKSTYGKWVTTYGEWAPMTRLPRKGRGIGANVWGMGDHIKMRKMNGTYGKWVTTTR